MKRYAFFLLFLSISVQSENIKESDLVGSWYPSGEFSREQGVANYKLIVEESMEAKYIDIDSPEKGTTLVCDYKPSNSQNSIFIFYCFLDGNHLITLSLGGWKSSSIDLLFGYEYWLGYPESGKIHGGLPVSLARKTGDR